MVVRVYRNLHRGGYSIQTVKPGIGWRVIGHADYLRLTQVTFKVNEGGRQRVIKQKHKDVHAFVIGTLDNSEFASEIPISDRISYNPYRWGHFYRCEDLSPVHEVSIVHLTPSGVYGR